MQRTKEVFACAREESCDCSQNTLVASPCQLSVLQMHFLVHTNHLYPIENSSYV